MRRWHWFAFVVCIALSALVWWKTRELDAAQPEPTVVAVEPPPGPSSVTNPIDRDATARELAKLRNEVTQLRSQKRLLDTVRQERAALTAAQAPKPAAPHVTPPGFIAKDNLANAGFATPDDAMQTFFWAIREGDMEAAIQALSPSSRERLRMERLTPEQRAEMQRDFKGKGRQEMLNHFTEVGIRSRETVSDDVMVLHVGSSFTTNTMPMRVERTAEGWKLRDPL